MNVKSDISEAISVYIGFSYTPNRSPKILIPLSDIAYFAVR